MARFGGLFHLCRSIPNPFKKKRRFDNALHKFRHRLPSLAKNSAAQNWHKAAQKILAHYPFCSLSKPETSSARLHVMSMVEREYSTTDLP
jgi:hypothetical protein